MNKELMDWSTHLPISLVVLDGNMDLVDASRAAFSMFRIRYHASEKERSIAQLSDYFLSRPSFVSAIGEATFKLTGLGSRDRFRWQDGTRIYDIEISAMPPEDCMHFGLYFEDITQKVAFEQNLEITRNYLEQVIDSLPLGVVVVDQNMCVTAMNKVRHNFLTHSDSEDSRLKAVGLHISELLTEHEGMSWSELSDLLFVKRQGVHHIEHSCEIDGVEHIFTSDIIPLQEDTGEVVGAMHITEDITTQRRLQAEARESEMLSARLELLQQTAVTLNHVVNNKLMSIMCNIEVARSAQRPAPDVKDRTLNSAMDELASIADFIRDLAGLKEIKTTAYLKGGEKMLDVYGKYTYFPQED